MIGSWPRRPVIYEINTWVWLYELSQTHQRTVTLSNVPEEEWEEIAALYADAVWLMGVWERSPAGRSIANHSPGNLADFHRALPDFQPEDNVGSPYCVRNYVVDNHLGGPDGLVAARQALAKRNMHLVLDFVPNHVAPDHPWVTDHPEYFIQGDAEDLARDPGSFIQVKNGVILACGRDPYFPAWSDVVQVNAFHPDLRQAVLETVNDIASQCDGLRCDMAMLMVNHVFSQTWGSRAGPIPSQEYWQELIPAVKDQHPDTLFMAEAYWDLEWELQQQGFDYCYDKRLYDRLEHGSAESVRQHLGAPLAYQDKLVRFIENHDEPRAVTAFPGLRSLVAAVAVATLPGAKLFHQGQLEGWTVRLPVFLRRRSLEQPDLELQNFYRKLLSAMNTPPLREGEWQLCECSGWQDNPSYQNLVAWGWRSNTSHSLIVVNLSANAVQGRVRVPWPDIAGETWQLVDLINDLEFDRPGSEMIEPGLYVDLSPWGFHFLYF